MAFLFFYGGRPTVCDPYHMREQQQGRMDVILTSGGWQRLLCAS
jgi:hypothetical protein